MTTSRAATPIPPDSLHGSASPTALPGSRGARYGRMFPFLPERDAGTAALGKLVEAMRSRPDGKNNISLTAGYTYLGQFVDHDITFDAESSLRRDNDPARLVNFRTPRLDLDSLYGSGPADQPYLYDRGAAGRNGAKLLVTCNPPDTDRAPLDLPRNAQGRAIIGDPRNDENLIVSQLHLLFTRFHNSVVDYLCDEHGHDEGPALFEDARRLVRWHYQWIVAHDFLPKIVGGQMANSVLPGAAPGAPSSAVKRRPYSWPDDPFIPVEFSAAAFRVGHSMVRPTYRINDRVPEHRVAILPHDAHTPDDAHLAGRRWLLAALAIQWTRFFSPDDPLDPEKVNLALRFDEKLAEPLYRLPVALTLGELPEVSDPAQPPPPTTQLALLNLHRARALGLPSGADVALALGEIPLTADELFPGYMQAPLTGVKEALFEATPLWYYILRDADLHGAEGKRLGPVGGAIVAEVLVGLLESDPDSYLRSEPDWRPMLPACHARDFTMIDLIRFAQDPCETRPDCPPPA